MTLFSPPSCPRICSVLASNSMRQSEMPSWSAIEGITGRFVAMCVINSLIMLGAKD